MIFSYFFQAAMGVGLAICILSIPYIIYFRRQR